MPFLSFPMPITSLPEHKIGVFVLFWPSGPPFSGISSTKSMFLCLFGFRDPRFRAFRAQNWGFCAFLLSGTPVFGHFRAQNRGFCALLGSGTLIFGLFEHKIGVFVLGKLMCGIGRSATLNFCGHRAKSSASGSAQLCCM